MSKTATFVLRRLHGIVTTSTAAVTAPTAAATSTTTTTAVATSAVMNPHIDYKQKKIQRYVENFKKSSESDRFRTQHSLYAATVRRLAASKNFSMIDEILQHQKKFKDITSEEFVIRLILLYGYAGMFENAYKLFEEMPQLKCERTVKSFNALLSSCINTREFDKAEEFMKELPEKLGITPDVVTYNTMVKAFCRMDALDKALLTLDEMEKNGLEPDTITFNTLLEAFYKNGRCAEGDKVWDLMETKNVVPNIRTYNSKLRGLVKDSRISDAVKLVEEMESKEIKPDVHSYNALIAGFCGEGNLAEAMEWCKLLKEKGYNADTVTYAMLVPFLCRSGDLDLAVELCKEAITRRVLTRPAMFKPVVDALVKESRQEEAVKLVESAKLKNYFSYNKGLNLKE